MTADRHERSLVAYDADCGLCMWLLAGLLRWDRRRRLRPLALQDPEADVMLAELTPAERMASWHLVSEAGAVHSGGAAVAPLLRLLPGGRLPAGVFARLPAATDRSYRLVAARRGSLSRLLPSAAKRRARERVRGRERELAQRDRR